MVLTLAATLVLSLLVKSSSQEQCGGNTVTKLVSDPDSLVSISANPQLEWDPKVDPSQVEISESNTDPWCSVPPPAGVAFDPYLKFEFNSTYLIEFVKISGSSNGNEFVRALTIQNDTGEGFAFINDNGTPKVFDTFLMDGGDVRNISFMEEPVLATSLRIRPFNWTANSPCMRIELYGCLYITSQNSPTSTSNDTKKEFDSFIIIAVGIGAAIFGALVATTVILAVVGIVCCCKKIRPTDASARIYSTSSGAYGIAQKYNIELQANECYNLPVSRPAEQASVTQYYEDSGYTYPLLPTTNNKV